MSAGLLIDAWNGAWGQSSAWSFAWGTQRASIDAHRKAQRSVNEEQARAFKVRKAELREAILASMQSEELAEVRETAAPHLMAREHGRPKINWSALKLDVQAQMAILALWNEHKAMLDDEEAAMLLLAN